MNLQTFIPVAIMLKRNAMFWLQHFYNLNLTFLHI